MKYSQLTQEERYQISALLKARHNQTEISMILGRHKSTISREIHHNTGLRGYRPKQAQRLAQGRRWAKALPRLTPDVWADVVILLRQDWSPEQISLWLAEEKSIRISHEWIYHYILQDKSNGGDLYRHLRCQKRYGVYSHRGQIPHQVSIEQRPAIVDARTRFGDWELDTVIGKNHQQALVTLVERKSRLTLIQGRPQNRRQCYSGHCRPT